MCCMYHVDGRRIPRMGPLAPGPCPVAFGPVRELPGLVRELPGSVRERPDPIGKLPAQVHELRGQSKINLPSASSFVDRFVIATRWLTSVSVAACNPRMPDDRPRNTKPMRVWLAVILLVLGLGPNHTSHTQSEAESDVVSASRRRRLRMRSPPYGGPPGRSAVRSASGWLAGGSGVGSHVVVWGACAPSPLSDAPKYQC